MHTWYPKSLRANEFKRRIVEIYERQDKRNYMSKKEKSPEITAAWIGVAGTLIVTVVTIILTRPQSPVDPATPVPVVITATTMSTVVPTDTVPPGESTSTPAPTDTPAPTATEVEPVEIGQDWAQGCVSSSWVAYPGTIAVTDKGDGCLAQPINKFFASDGRLAFLYKDRVASEEIYGLFAPLSSSEGTVSLDISLRELINGDVWVGIFAEPDINSAGMILVIPEGNVKNRNVTQKTMPGQITKDITTTINSNPPVYNVVLSYNSGSIAGSVPALKYNFTSVSVPSANKWLFVGYRLVTGTNNIDAEFLNLTIK